jgi:propanol-preferring alcohol dehydrogenase
MAREAGAHQVIKSDSDIVANIRDIAGPSPGGADVVLDFVGSPSTVDIARALVAAGGDIAIVGLGGGMLPVGFGSLPFEVRVCVPFWGTKAELAQVIALARAGRIRAQVERFSLAEAKTAYERLRSGQVRGRAVIIPNESPK